MPSNHLIIRRPFLIPPSIFPSIRVFSNEWVIRIRWPKYWSFSFSISPSKEFSCLGIGKIGEVCIFHSIFFFQFLCELETSLHAYQNKNTTDHLYLYHFKNCVPTSQCGRWDILWACPCLTMRVNLRHPQFFVCMCTHTYTYRHNLALHFLLIIQNFLFIEAKSRGLFYIVSFFFFFFLSNSNLSFKSCFFRKLFFILLQANSNASNCTHYVPSFIIEDGRSS